MTARTLAVFVFALLAACAAPSRGLAAPPPELLGAWDAYRAVVASATDSSDVVVAARAVSDAARASTVDQFPSLSYVILRDAEALLKRGETDAALYLARIASALSPKLWAPHAWQANVYFSGPNPNAVAGVKEWIAAFKASFQDFWSLLYRIDRWLAAAVLALLSAAVLVMAVFMMRVVPLLGHLLVEWSGNRLFRPTAGLLAAWVVVLPLVAVRWGAWFVLVPGVVLWWFLSRRERAVLTALAGVGVAAALIIPRAMPLLTADQSTEFRLVVEVAEGRDPSRALDDAEIVDSARGAAARASALAMSGRPDEAATLFEEALIRWPNDPRLLTDYGNLLFRRGEYKKSASLYEQARAVVPNSVPVLYNLSQVYRADLRFEDGEAQYQKARAIDAGLLDWYGERAQRNDALAVADYPLAHFELLKDALHTQPSSPEIQTALSEVGRHVSTPVAIGVFTLFVGCWLLGRWFPNQPASPCETCGASVCRRCQRYFLDLKLCSTCWKSYAKGVKVTPRSTLPQALRRWETRRRFAACLAVIPGAGHASIGHPVWGALLAFAGSWLIWVGVLREVGWNTVGARLVPPPWYVTWGPIAAGICLMGFIAVYHLLTLRWSAAGSSLLPDRR
ncbi:MAG: tetratricopeptide repeat protein [Nitrospirota bacterium]